MDQYPKCGDCKKLYSGKKPPEVPPCAMCRLDPLPENADALRVFFQVRYQFIMGFSGPVDINHLAIDAAMAREEIANRRECFAKVTTLARWWLERVTKKQ